MLLHQTTVKLKTYYAFMNNYATQSIKKIPNLKDLGFLKLL